MNFIACFAKVFAIPILLFANFVSVDAQPDSIYRLPAGTRISLTMDSEINSKVASVNDTFTTSVSKDVKVQDAVVLPFGTVIEGRVTAVTSASVGGRNGRLELKFETIRFPDNRTRTINGSLVQELRAGSASASSVLSIAGGTAAGALIGAARGQTGILIGAGIGAGAGTAVAFLRKGKDVHIRTEQEFEIVLKSEVTLPVRDY